MFARTSRLALAFLTGLLLLASAAAQDFRQALKKPETAMEYWNAVLFEISVGKYDIAASNLKGFLEKVFLPGVAFELVDGKVRGRLRHLKRIGGVSTYGGTRLRAVLAGDPPRKLFSRVLRAYAGPAAPISYLGCYDMNRNGEPELKTFLAKVRRAYSSW